MFSPPEEAMYEDGTIGEVNKKWYEKFADYSNIQKSWLQYYYQKLQSGSDGDVTEDSIPTMPEMDIFIPPEPLLQDKKPRGLKPPCPDELVLFEYVESLGYPIEKHIVLTTDGYQLSLFRIKYPRDEALKRFSGEVLTEEMIKKRRSEVRHPVLLQHGLFNSAATWTVMGHDSLAFLLSDAGFDVWLGNSRGVQYSQQHCAFGPEDKEFWDFTFHDMQHDVVANVNYIIQCSKQPKLSYIGHSQGTTQMFIACSMNEDLQDKISLFVALAPATSLRYQTNKAIRLLAKMKPENIMEYMGFTEIGKRTISSKLLSGLSSPITSRLGVQNIASLFLDCDCNPEHIEAITKFEPSPTSYRNLTHWAQLCRSEHFSHRDYGTKENLRRYKAITPPPYDLSQVNIPIALFYGKKDHLASPRDIEEYLVPKLPKIIHQMQFDFKHNDFVWGKKSGNLYKHVTRLLLKYSK